MITVWLVKFIAKEIGLFLQAVSHHCWNKANIRCVVGAADFQLFISQVISGDLLYSAKRVIPEKISIGQRKYELILSASRISLQEILLWLSLLQQPIGVAIETILLTS